MLTSSSTQEFFSAWKNPEEEHEFEDEANFEEEGDFDEEGDYEEEENIDEEEAQPENENSSPTWDSWFDNRTEYVVYQYVESDSEEEDDADGPIELMSTGWHRFVASKATWKPCDTPEPSDSEPLTEDEEEEEDEDDEDEDEKEDDEDEKDEDLEPAEKDEEPEKDAEVAAEEPTHEETKETTEQTAVPQAEAAAEPETDLEEVEPDAELRSRAEQLQQSRKRRRDDEEEGYHGEDEAQRPRVQRPRVEYWNARDHWIGPRPQVVACSYLHQFLLTRLNLSMLATVYLICTSRRPGMPFFLLTAVNQRKSTFHLTV